jgi:hypothetical protein
MLPKKNRTGSQHLAVMVAVVIVFMLMFVLLGVMLGIRDSVRNGFNAQELIGTVVIQAGVGLCAAILWLLVSVILLGGIIGTFIVVYFIRYRWHRISSKCLREDSETDDETVIGQNGRKKDRRSR